MTHDVPHGEISTEFHRPPGPLTLVPLPGDRSSVVWVETRGLAKQFLELGAEALAPQLEKNVHAILGHTKVDASSLGMFPLSGLVPKRLGALCVMLIGEAAHVFPPIGAQGLNLGLRDGAVAADVVARMARQPADTVCNAYDKARRVDVVSRTLGVDLMNRSLLSSMLPAQMLRAGGISALRNLSWLRRTAMREGIEPHLGLPPLMRRSDVQSSSASSD